MAYNSVEKLPENHAALYPVKHLDVVVPAPLHRCVKLFNSTLAPTSASLFGRGQRVRQLLLPCAKGRSVVVGVVDDANESCAWGGSSSLKTASRDARWGLSPYRVTEEGDLVGRRSGTPGAVWLYAVSNVDEAVHLCRLRGACSSGSRSTSGGETPHSSVRRCVYERDHPSFWYLL